MKKIILITLILITTSQLQINAQETNNLSQNKFDLAKAGIIGVTIGGSFIVNGTFPAVMTDRVDQFITRIYSEYKLQSLSGIKESSILMKYKNELENFAKRDIILKRFSGETVKIDLEKYRLTGDFKFNPYLKNDDVIIFPAVDMNTNFIDVSGAVNKEVKFQFVEGDNLLDAILFAGGINPAFANVSKAEISRLNSSGEKEEIIAINLKSDIQLMRGDRIRIPFDATYRKDYKVLVLGEVSKPGYIYITNNNTTIRELITKAGGFTSRSSLGMSELIRSTDANQLLKLDAVRKEYEKNPNLDINNFQKEFNVKTLEDLQMFRMADISNEDSLYLLVDNSLRLFQSRGIVDFTKIHSNDFNDGNFIVKDGDIILVPQKDDLVFVFGQVNNPGFTKYYQGKDYNYYLNAAGGLGEDAESDVKVIKGKTRSWITADESVEIDPGDYIYVPKNVPKKLEWYVRQAGSLSSIIAAIATIILVIVQSGK